MIKASYQERRSKMSTKSHQDNHAGAGNTHAGAGKKGGSTPGSASDITTFSIFLATVQKIHAVRKLYGVVEMEDRGYVLDGEPSPCYRWCGRFKGGLPIVHAMNSSYRPTSLIAKSNGIAGATFTSCGHDDCVRPEHIRVISHSALARRSHRSEKRRPMIRDEKGRFVAPM